MKKYIRLVLTRRRDGPRRGTRRYLRDRNLTKLVLIYAASSKSTFRFIIPSTRPKKKEEIKIFIRINYSEISRLYKILKDKYFYYLHSYGVSAFIEYVDRYIFTYTFRGKYIILGG